MGNRIAVITMGSDGIRIDVSGAVTTFARARDLAESWAHRELRDKHEREKLDKIRAVVNAALKATEPTPMLASSIREILDDGIPF